MNSEIEQAKTYLLTPWVFHNWLRQKMPWSTVLNEFAPTYFTVYDFLYDRGVEENNIVISHRELVYVTGERERFSFKPWLTNFLDRIETSRFSGSQVIGKWERVTAFHALKTLYKVEGEYARHPEMRRN